MDHFIDIKVLPDPEFLETTLMNALYAKLHRALVSHGKNSIGVSFPEHTKSLGSVLRLHGTKNDLEQLMEIQWIHGLRDYMQITAIETVPENAKYCVVTRVQSKSSVARLRRRSIAKGWLTEGEANNHIKKDQEKRLTLPFLQLKSQSTGQSFRLFIRHSVISEQKKSGDFSTYGLSRNSSVPWF